MRSRPGGGPCAASRRRRPAACGRRAWRAARGRPGSTRWAAASSCSRRSGGSAVSPRATRRIASNSSAAARGLVDDAVRARDAGEQLDLVVGQRRVDDHRAAVARLGLEPAAAARCRRRRAGGARAAPRPGARGRASSGASATPGAAPTGTSPRLGAQEQREPGADRRLGIDDSDAGHVRDTVPGRLQPDLNARLRRPANVEAVPPRRARARGLTKRYDDGFLALDARRPDGRRRRVLRPARPERRRQDDADLRRLQPDPRHRGRGARVRPPARRARGAPADRPRRAGRQPRPLPRRGGDAALPRRLLRDGPRARAAPRAAR